MSEILNTIWGYVLPIGGGITIGAVIVAIGTIIIKSVVSKLLSKVNVEKVEEKAVAQGIEKIKSLSFTQSIQPLCESELEKITEKANKYIDKSLSRVNDKLDKLGTCLTILSSYFDGSIAVSDEKKEQMKNALATLKEEKIATEQEIKVVEEQVKEQVIEEIKEEIKEDKVVLER